MDTIVTKKCSKCGEIKFLENFHKQKLSIDGFGSWCKSCKHLRRSIDYKNNKSEQNKNAIKWKKEHRKIISRKNKEAYHKDVELSRLKYRIYNGRYRKSHPEKITQYNNDHRARILQSGGTIKSDEWLSLCNKYGNVCLCCGKGDVKLTIDHVVPLSKGGANLITNVQPLCKSCNSKKGTQTIDYRRK